MKFTAYAAANTNGSRCETVFEVDDETLADMSEDEKEEYLHEAAMDAVFEAGLVRVWHEETGE